MRVPGCRGFSRAYLRHLFVCGEMLAARLLTTHNLHFYLERMARLARAPSSRRSARSCRDGRELTRCMENESMNQVRRSVRSPLVQLAPFALILVVFYFLLVRPQQQKAQETQEMLDGFASNDEIVTTGGLYGTDRAARRQGPGHVEIAPKVQVRIDRPAVSQVWPRARPASPRQGARGEVRMNPGNVVYRLDRCSLALTVRCARSTSAPLVLPGGTSAAEVPAREPIHLGLDLRGGTHLLFTVDVDKAVENAVGRTADELGRELKDEKHRGREHRPARASSCVVHLKSGDQRATLDEFVAQRFPNLEIERRQRGRAAHRCSTLTPSAREQEQIKRFALEQSLETIRNRIDQFGVSEPIIQRQGEQRHRRAASRRAGSAARQGADRQARRCSSSSSSPTKAGRRHGDAARPRSPSAGATTDYLLEKKVLMTGDAVADARVRPGTQLEGPYVELILSDRGAREFEHVTGENVGRNLAIVLDGKVVLGAGDPREDRRRSRVDHRQLRHQGGARPGDRAARRRAARADQDRRGAHRRAVARPRLDPSGHHVAARRWRRS